MTLKKILTIGAFALALNACDGNNGNGNDGGTDTDLPDVPAISEEDTNIPAMMEPCLDYNVSFQVPEYSDYLNAGVRVGSQVFCETDYAPSDGRTLNCTIDTCDDEGNTNFEPGMTDVCVFAENDNGDLEEVCSEVEIKDNNSLAVYASCAQDAVYKNKAQCTIDDMTGLEGTPTCDLLRGGDVIASNDCGTPLVDANAPQGSVDYTVRLTENPSGNTAEDTANVNMDYEKPAIGECLTSGSPGNFVSATCQRADPVTPDGYSTLFEVVDSNLPVEAGGWLIDQELGDHRSANPTPTTLDMGTLYLTTKNCVDYNANGIVDAEENNCDEKTIDNF